MSERRSRSDHKKSRRSYDNDMKDERMRDVSPKRSSKRDESRKYYKPKMSVDADGTLSLSIEETNKLRESLGLKPLKITEKEVPKKQEEPEDTDDDDVLEVKRRIALAKMRRKEREILRTKGLGESSSDEDDSAAAFVIKSRQVEEEKRLAELKRKQLEEQEREKEEQQQYSTKDLAGITIKHSKEVFGEKEVVLTLVDKGVLDEGGDELENIHILEDEKRNWKEIQKTRKATYDVYESLEQQNVDILPQYNEEKNNFIRESFKLNEKGDVDDREKKLADIKAKLATKKAGKTLYSLDEEPIGFAKDFKTKDEEKKVTVKKRKKKKASLRKKFTLEPIEEPSKKDHGSRRLRDEQDDHKERIQKQIERERAFQRAIEKAKEESKRLEELVNAEKEEEELARIERLKKRNMMVPILPLPSEEEEEDIKPKDGIVIRPTSEFVRNIQSTPLYEEVKKRTIIKEEMKQMKEEDVEMKDEEIRDELEIKVGQGNRWKDVTVKEEKSTEQPKESTDESKTSEPSKAPKTEKEDHVALLEEPIVAKGLFATIQYAAQKGILEDNKSDEEETKDKSKKEKIFKINLDKHDKYGRVMTAKQAWKEMSHVFHGKRPGKNKMEKERRRYLEELKRQQMTGTDAQLRTMSVIEKLTEATATPYVAVDKLDVQINLDKKRKTTKEGENKKKKQKIE